MPAPASRRCAHILICPDPPSSSPASFAFLVSVTEASSVADAPLDPARRALRQRLLAERGVFLATPAAVAATEALAAALREVVAELEPEPRPLLRLRFQFNAAAARRRPASPTCLWRCHLRRGPKRWVRRGDGGARRNWRRRVRHRLRRRRRGRTDVLVVPCVGSATPATPRLRWRLLRPLAVRAPRRDRDRRRLVLRPDRSGNLRGAAARRGADADRHRTGRALAGAAAFARGGDRPLVSTAARVAAAWASTQAPNSITSERARLAGATSIQ